MQETKGVDDESEADGSDEEVRVSRLIWWTMCQMMMLP